MEINVNKKIKVVEIWLTNEDKNNAAMSDFIKGKISEYKQIKYKTVVFYSGFQDLFSCTEALIKNNL